MPPAARPRRRAGEGLPLGGIAGYSDTRVAAYSRSWSLASSERRERNPPRRVGMTARPGRGGGLAAYLAIRLAEYSAMQLVGLVRATSGSGQTASAGVSRLGGQWWPSPRPPSVSPSPQGGGDGRGEGEFNDLAAGDTAPMGLCRIHPPKSAWGSDASKNPSAAGAERPTVRRRIGDPP
jgi:hypothetical protein